MKRILAALAFLPLLASLGSAQSVTVSGSHLEDASGNPLTGTIYFKPALPFRVTGSGQIINSTVAATVTSGAFSLSLADTTQATPLNSCYVAWAEDQNSNVVLGSKFAGTEATRQGYGCVQVSPSWCTSGNCNFDVYNPVGSPLAIIQSGPSGSNATVAIGSVTSGPPEVTNSGTETNAVLNFVLPTASTELSDAATLLRSNDSSVQSLTGPLAGPNINKSESLSAWGDSLTFGGQDGTGHNYPGYLQALTGRYVKNWGYPGQTSAQIAARFLNFPSAYKDFSIFWECRNDISQSISTSTCEANIASQVNALPSGARFLVMTVINNQTEPTGSAGFNEAAAINAWITSTYPNNYVDIRSILLANYTPSNGADAANHAAGIPPISLRAVDSTGTLTAAINDTTSCPQTTGLAGFVGETVLIDSEYIVTTAVNGSGQITACTRGYGSTATTHANGAPYQFIDIEHLNAAGYLLVAQTAAGFLSANDPVSGAASSFFPTDTLNNLAIGHSALNSNTTGQFNTIVGNYAFEANQTGIADDAFGFQALYKNTSGSYNDGFGYEALNSNVTGNDNDAFGFGALLASTGNDNAAFGYLALENTTASGNSAFGSMALTADTTGNQNAAFGFSALKSDTSGSANSSFGYFTLGANTTGSNNSGFGFGALDLNTTGADNSAFGYSALLSNTTGNSNSAFGFDSMEFNTTGSFNSAFGFGSFNSNTTGSYGAAFGYNALLLNTTGGANSAFGYSSLTANTTGSDNSGFGYFTLGANTTGSYNSAFGFGALDINTTGANNSAFGYNALIANTTGGSNVAFGGTALASNTTGGSNAAMGYGALNANVTGSQNSAFGFGALNANTASGNSAFGFNVLALNTSGANNAGFGYYTLGANTTGGNNSAFGWGALDLNTSGSNNSAFGYESMLSNTTGTMNSALGYGSLEQNTTGSSNTAGGYGALNLNTTGGNNSAWGYTALNANTTGHDNVSIGFDSLLLSTTGADDTAVGDAALNGNTTGSGNTALGYLAGVGPGGSSNTTGSNNTYLGSLTSSASSTQQNYQTLIGAGASLSCSNCGVIGRYTDVFVIGGLFAVSTNPIPACGGQFAPADSEAWVADGVATPAYLATYAGGGSSRQKVACNGTAWQYH